MIKILISAVGGDIGQGILKSLREIRPKVCIVGCDMNPNSAGLFLCKKAYLVSGAKNNPKKYIKDIINICRKEKIDIVFSAQPYELNVLCSKIDYLRKKTGAYFAIQSEKVWNLCMDKLKTYQFLEKAGIKSPETYAIKKGFNILSKKYGFPLLLKARSSLGSGFHNYVLVNNKSEFNKAWEEIENPIVQEYISDKEGEEYTVGVFLDKNSKAIASIPMLRELRFGLTFHAVVGDYPDISALAIKTAESIGAKGPCNVQIRRTKAGNPCVIEINARISSTTAFRSHFGFNEAKACIDYFLKNKKPNLTFKNGVAMKSWTEIYTSKEKYFSLKKKGKI